MAGSAAEDKIHRFFCTTIAGLEEIVVDDLMAQLPGSSGYRSEKAGRHGRVFFEYRRSPRRLPELDSVTNAFGLLLDFRGVTSGRPGLAGLCGKIAQMNVRAAQRLLAACEPDAHVERYQLQASLRGRHRFTRSDLRQAVSTVLEKEHGLQPGRGEGMRFHLQVADRRATLGLQLTNCRSPGALERDGISGPLLYCIGRLLDLQSEEIVVLNACGPQAHRHLWRSGPPRAAVACHHERVGGALPERAGSSAGSSGLTLLAVGSAIHLPFESSGVDCVVTNETGLPQPAARSSLRECSRILKPQGIAVVITAEPREFVELIMHGGLPLAITASLPAFVAGRKYVIFLLEKLDLLSIEGI